MMNNLFSTFDPCTGSLSMNWLSSMIITMILPLNMWTTNSIMMTLMNKMIELLIKEVKMILKQKGIMILPMTMFTMILIININGILPYVYTPSSHISFSLSIALPMWTSLMMYGWFNKTNYMFKHLVPVGTPTVLMPIMVLIETISNFIRPGSLAVRLSANMIAGNILMSLLGNNNNMKSMIILMTMFSLLFMFESAVAMIQSYVFMTLSTLYSSEI